MLNTSYLMGLLIFTATVVAYTTYGGFRAVAWTDTMQGIVMIVGIVVGLLAIFLAWHNRRRNRRQRPQGPMRTIPVEPPVGANLD